jgi:hypothetical protein
MSHQNVPSPPSFYAIPPPPPHSSSISNEHSFQQQMHQASVNQSYYNPATHPYMAHYPPPPPPAMTQMDPRERGPIKRKTEYEEHQFNPYGYPQQQQQQQPQPQQPRHYTYGHSASGPSPVSYGKQQSATNGSYDVNRGNKMNASRSSASDVYGLALGDQQPTYVGHIKSANDAILLLSACDLPSNTSATPDAKTRDNVLPPPRRVTRRLLDAERADLVASGSVFVWDEKEAGMKRWTDGRVWSASRVSGCFLTYRELEARKKMNSSGSVMVDGPATNQYKPDGLIKQSFSITTSSGRKLHVISYFTKRDIREGRLRRVGEDPRFVGEGGGEWGLKVDEQEYSFPDMQQIGRVNGHGENGSTSLSRDQGDDDDSEVSDLSDRRSASPARHQATSILDMKEDSKRKRSPKEIEDDDQKTARPRLSRVRSSSMSGLQSSGMNSSGVNSSEVIVNDSSLQSSSSFATTVPSESFSRGKEAKYKHTGLSVSTNNRGRSSAIRALLSPTMPRESAIRDSACEMKPTQSQDCANAVGALLSLAGTSSSESTSASVPPTMAFEANLFEAKPSIAAQVMTSPTLKKEASNSPSSSPTSAHSAGLGLNTKATPKRRDLDLAALNKFSVRL